MKRGAVSKAGV